MKYLILNALLITPLAHADKLYIGAKSYHIPKNTDFNETHALVAYERGGVIGGYFNNSHDDDTFFLAKRYYHQFSEQTTGSIMVGAMYGYKGDCLDPGPVGKTRLCPMVSLAIEHRFDLGKLDPLGNLITLGNAIATMPGVEW